MEGVVDGGAKEEVLRGGAPRGRCCRGDARRRLLRGGGGVRDGANVGLDDEDQQHGGCWGQCRGGVWGVVRAALGGGVWGGNGGFCS